MRRFMHQQKIVISIHNTYLICAVQGTLTPPVVWAAYTSVVPHIPENISGVLFIGNDLHYAGPDGIAALSECIEKLQTHWPALAIRCAHISPVIRAAWNLGGLHNSDMFESDSAAALRWFAKRRKHGFDNAKTHN